MTRKASQTCDTRSTYAICQGVRVGVFGYGTSVGISLSLCVNKLFHCSRDQLDTHLRIHDLGVQLKTYILSHYQRPHLRLQRSSDPFNSPEIFRVMSTLRQFHDLHVETPLHTLHKIDNVQVGTPQAPASGGPKQVDDMENRFELLMPAGTGGKLIT